METDSGSDFSPHLTRSTRELSRTLALSGKSRLAVQGDPGFIYCRLQSRRAPAGEPAEGTRWRRFRGACASTCSRPARTLRHPVKGRARL